MATENFSWLLLDPTGESITGANPLPTLLIRRVDDGAMYDFSDETFKSIYWTSKLGDMLEVDSENLQGVYELSVDVSSFNGTFRAYVNYTGEYKQQGSSEFKVFNGVVRTNPSSKITAEDKADIAELTAKDVWGYTE